MEKEQRLIDAKKLPYTIAVDDNGRQIFYVKAEAIDEAPTVDAVPVVRCKDCVHRGEPTQCPMCFDEWMEYEDGDGYYDSDLLIHDRSIDEGFCDRGEREDNEWIYETDRHRNGCIT